MVRKQESWVINFSLSTPARILFNACPVKSQQRLIFALLKTWRQKCLNYIALQFALQLQNDYDGDGVE